MSTLGPEDFDSDEYREAIAAADKFTERRRRGLPSDRWAASENELQAVADGIEAYRAMCWMFSEAWTEMLADKAQRDRDSMSMGESRDPK